MKFSGCMRILGKVLVVTAIVASPGCKKDDDDKKDSAAPSVGNGATGSTISANALMLNIDVSCNGNPCIAENESLQLADSSEETFVQTVRGFYWLITGFASEAAYTEFVPDEIKDLIPESGLVGRIQQVREHVVETIVSNSSGISTCTDVLPITGSFDVENDGTYTLTAAQNSAPAPFPKSGTYDKRLEYTGAEFDAVFEWFCDYDGMMVKFVYKGDYEGFNYAFYYDRADEADGHFEFHLNDEGGTIGEGVKTVSLRNNILADSFRLWMTQSENDGTNYTGYRAASHTEIASQETSLWYQDISNMTLTEAAFNSHAAVKSKVVSGGGAPNAGNDWDAKQGCAQDFSVLAHTITSSTLCSGLDLTVPDAPALDADGNWSMGWMKDNVASKIEAL